jgi:trehalose 6-phosphate synthase
VEHDPVTRLVVVSNRVTAPTGSNSGAQGGLAVALQAALREHGGLWFGWSGDEVETFTGELHVEERDYTSATIDLEPQDVEEYYEGYANRTLWPLFHYRVDLTEFERTFAGGYERVNARFATALSPLLEPEDAVWVQDYHMFPLGDELRRRGHRNRLGFFLHIPWPPRRLLTTLPEAKRLVESLLAYDVVGFQTEEWLEAFVEYAVEGLGGTVADGILTLGDRMTQLLACPIGIDTADFVAASRSTRARLTYRQIRDSAVGRDMMIGVDRLDYSKGLEERFAGYERFLDRHPEERKEVFLLQIAPPSRATVETYRRIRSSLEGLAGRINGAHADYDWVPIRYVNQGYPRDVLAGIYRAARIGLVTPLRDGMNLVAKEYVAAQNPDDPGVLILSRFAGAAEQMTEALLVNPHSADEVADAILAALKMSKEERVRRWRALMDGVEREDVMWWRRRFTDALLAPPSAMGPVHSAFNADAA